MPSTREWAIIIIFGLVFLLALKSNRKRMLSSFGNVIKAFFSLFRLVYMQVITLYTILVTYFLIWVGFLEWKMTTSYIIVTLFSVVPLVIRSGMVNSQNDWRKESYKMIKFAIIPIFIINNYTMHIILEVVFGIVAVLSSICLLLAEKEQYDPIMKKFFQTLISIVGLTYIGYAIYDISNNLDDLKQPVFWKSLGLGFTVFLYYPLMLILIRYKKNFNVLQFPKKKRKAS